MNLLKYLITRKTNMKSTIPYTKENLLKLFPKHEKVDIITIENMLDKLFDNCNRYTEIFNYFNEFIESCFFGSNKIDYDSPIYKEYSSYRYGNREDRTILTIYQWIHLVEEYYIHTKGKFRTLEEASCIAADKWCDLIFGHHIQDNGAINESYAGGFMACALGTLLKDEYNKDITEDMIKKARETFYNYFMNGSIYKDEKDDYESQINLYCDYGPNVALYSILEKSGIPEKAITNICPWKTGVHIDYNNNSVVIIGYQKREYI